ncbi:MAG: FecR domain-containing protein [Chitinophagaceae bacterium]
MQEKVDNISSLIVKYLRENLDDSERDALDKWRTESEANQQKFEELSNEAILSQKVKKFNDYDREQNWNKIVAALGLDMEASVYSLEPRKGYRKLYAAAAAILLLLAVGGWYYLTQGSKPPQPAAVTTIPQNEPSAEHGKSVYKNDVQPGGNKALLTLANGTVIDLNDATSGILAEESGIAIRKTGDGKLEYQATVIPGKDVVGFNSLSTPAGGQFQIRLPDGSVIWLNAATTIKFPLSFSGDDREVKLTGEAYFEVATQIADGHKTPFKVKVGNNAAIEVLGTHFNVSSYAGDSKVKTTLLEGSVKIVKNNRSSILKPGQQAVIGKSDEIEVVKKTDTNEAVAWKNGEFKFESADIKEVMGQISRWYNVDVIYDGDFSNVHFSGTMSRYVSVIKILDMLQLTGEIHFVVDGRKVTVIPH